ncbi:MAG: HD domain-containing protein [Chloroflexi bacterium]|nr:HD domain-containing protein [Chloroflexota bacterium]
MVDVAGETLARPGPLTPDEWERMLVHPRRSGERLRGAGVLLAQAQRGALHHHERWDGHGYPERQRGPEIPIEARYVAIADAYTAMTSDRPYRARRSSYGAIAEMVADGGFEPRLLRLFVPLLAEAA